MAVSHLESSPTEISAVGAYYIRSRRSDRTPERQLKADPNSFARTGKDLEYQRGEDPNDRFYGDPSVHPNPNLRPCQTGPFYALPIYPGNIRTIFGHLANADAQVLDKSGQTIPGLYAVGCDQNSVFKGGYPGGGSSIGPGMTFGYRAGMKLSGELE